MRIAAILFLILVAMLALPVASTAETDSQLTVLSDTDLTQPFHTRTAWRLIVRKSPDREDDLGAILVCFLHNNKYECPDISVHFCVFLDGKTTCPGGADFTSPTPFNIFDSIKIRYPNKSSKVPLLVVTLDGNWNGSGNARGPLIWAYRPEGDRFEQIFQGSSGANVNGETRFVEDGPLSGDVILNYPTSRAPYRYFITVYRLSKKLHYTEILHYRSKTGWNDGNPLAVIDSEMPEIQRRLHLWKSGDPLPIPLEMPDRCSTLEMRHGVEWCR